MSKWPLKTDVVIIGGGAAGLMCAIEAGKRGRRTVLLEHNDRLGKKIRISGGGRCNFTNLHAQPQSYLSSNPHFAKSALAQYSPKDICQLLQRHRIPFHEKKLGQLFCDESAQDVIDLLQKECETHGVQILLNSKVHSVEKNGPFTLKTSTGHFETESLVVATGGLSIPSLGATDLGYQIARQFGLNVVTPKPGLVPILWKKSDREIFQSISGVSLDAIVSFKNVGFRENLLFTHRGLSGPAILQISSYWQEGKPLTINLLPEVDILQILKNHARNKMEMKNFLSQYLPKRFADIFAAAYLKNRPLNQYSAKELTEAAQILQNWHIIPAGTEGYAKAEVTVGGVDCRDLSSKTMEAKEVPGLYLIGEVVDVTGHLGGYNFQWAWASGFVAGQYV